MRTKKSLFTTPKYYTISAILVIILILYNFPYFIGQLFAQDSSGIATYIQVQDKNVQPGSIISFSSSGYHLSKVAYDPSVFAVTSASPSASFDEPLSNNNIAAVNSGKIYILVSNNNGAIKVNDLITTSTTPGVGEKAIQDGYVVGTALESYNSKTPGRILVELNFGFHSAPAGLRSNLFQNLNLAFAAPFLTPVTSLRYILAGLVAILAFGLGLFFFGRVTRKGIDAIGRNPLAGRTIMASVILNLLIALGTMIVGIVVAYLILVL